MKLAEVLDQLGLAEAQELFLPHWEESLASLPEGIPSFLSFDEIQESVTWSGLPSQAKDQLVQAAARIRQQPALVALAWHCYRLLYEHVDYDKSKEWPYPEQALGDDSGIFYLLIAMALVPRVVALHRRWRIDEDVTSDTCQQIGCFAENYRWMSDGKLGIPVSQLYWLRHYDAGRLFRVGRFEYMFKEYKANIRVYRHLDSGRILALAGPDLRYNEEGYVDAEGTWTSTLNIDETGTTGNPISPRGFAVNRQIHLARGEWELVLKSGDNTLDMHIPEGGRMSLDKCFDSFQRATLFFSQQFPEQPFNNITSSSWIFNTQLEQIKLSSDNLVRFQHELYLYPVRSSGQDGLWFIYRQTPFNLATAQRKTSLQRGVADFLAAGNTWRSGGMFFLTADLKHFGTQYYRRREME